MPAKLKPGEKPKFFINRIMYPSRLKKYENYIPTKKDLFLDDILRTSNKFSSRRQKFYYYYLEILDKYNVKPIGKPVAKARVEGTCTHKNCNKKYNKSLECLDRSECFLCNEHTEEHRKNLNIERHGFKTPFEKKETQEKLKKTLLERYGQDNAMKIPKFKEKAKKTCLKKYGFENTLAEGSVIRKKRDEAMEKKYGSKYYSQTPEWKNKMNETCNERYGTDWAMQNSDISEKASNNAYNTKIYKFPSGNEIYVQGYENFALDILLKNGYKEEDIITSRREVPECWYIIDGKEKRYFTDIYIPNERRCIEIKSDWTFKRDIEDPKKISPLIKQQAMQELGYICEIWIIDGNGNVIDIIN